MYNNRALQDGRTQEALDKIMAIYRLYDLAGACCIINATEWGFAYQLPTTFNAFIEDPTLPMGFRIRAKSQDLGHDRAGAFVENSAHVIGALKDFGTQTQAWMSDLFRLLRKAGVHVSHRPFGGQRLPRLTKRKE